MSWATPDVILIIVGSSLLLIGLLGGGIRTRWSDIPNVSGMARILCGFVGMAFVIGGVWLKLGAPIAFFKTATSVTQSQSPAPSQAQDSSVATHKRIEPATDTTKSSTQPVAATTKKPVVTFFIACLVKGQDGTFYGVNHIYMDGVNLGDVKFDYEIPSKMVQLSISRPGNHHYKIISEPDTTPLPTSPEEGYEPNPKGAKINVGSIEIRQGSKFRIVPDSLTVLQKVD